MGLNVVSMKEMHIKNYACYPPQNEGNLFLPILQQALKDHGWYMTTFNLKYRSLYKNRLNTNLLYFHWPETIWRSKSLFVSIIKAANFAFLIKFSQLLGYKLAWSAHNTLPHEYKSLLLERLMRKFILSNFDLIINHAYNAKDEQANLFGKTGRLSVDAIHGHYEDYYQPANKISRSTLDIPAGNKVIYLNYSTKDYKGCDDFIASFIKYAPQNITLLISGPDVRKIIKTGPEFQRIVTIDRLLDNGELADVMCLTDAVALPYKRITTSGFYFLALTFKKVIFAKDLPFFRNHSTDNTIILYHDTNSLQRAFEQILSGWVPDRSEIELLLNQFSWKNSASLIAKKFDDIINV